MMNKLLNMLMVCFMTLLITQTADAGVYTEGKIDNGRKSVYVAGNPDFYPIEYYNKETNQYEGVMPDILRTVSENIGIDFTYLHIAGNSQTELAENLLTGIVSAYVTDGNESYAKDKVTVLSYLYKEKMVNIGWAFTEIADKELIETLKNEAKKITEKEINGYFVSNSNSKPQDKTWIIIISILCCILFAAVIVLILLKLKNAKEQIRDTKMTDAETGIGNLVYFENVFENTIFEFSRDSYYIAYIIIDSNYLQAYYGEAIVVDSVKYTANLLSSYVKQGEIAARITENGFVFAYQKNNIDEAKCLLEEIIKKLNLYIEADEDNMKTIFHAALYNLNHSDRNCGLLLFNLRKNCSRLMGTDTEITICDSKMINSAIEEKQMTESIINGFENHEFKLYLQFIVDNKTKDIVSAEALSRWDNPEKGILGPGKYIPVMEASGFITMLDYYMFEMTCRQLHKWKDTELGAITISCNFTRITLSEEDFIDKIKEIVSKYIFDNSQLIIEITEDAIEKNRASAMENVRKCKEMGFRIALDDMGSGYTSLINLCEYPIDIVKIDRDILLKADKKSGRDLFIGIIALAHSLNLKVVCEGVENEEQNALVSETECDLVQGWYYSNVFSVHEGEKFARQYQKN